MHIEKLREMVPLPSQSTIGVCKQITLLILYYFSSRLVTLLKIIHAPIQVPDTFILLFVPSSLNLAFRCLSFCSWNDC